MNTPVWQRGETRRIHIPGLHRTYRFMHITDLHMCTAYETESEIARQTAADRLPVFPAIDGYAPADRWPHYFAEAQRLHLDGIWLTGDIIDFPSQSNLDLLLNGLESSPIPAVYCFGNHDWSFFVDYHSPETERQYLPLFAPMAAESIHYAVAETDDFLIFAVDDTIDQIRPAALEKAREIFSQAKPVIVICHVPFSAETLIKPTTDVWGSPLLLGKDAIQPNADTQEFIARMTAPNSPVVAVVAGHIHFDHTDQLTPQLVQYTSAACFDGGYTLFEITAL